MDKKFKVIALAGETWVKGSKARTRKPYTYYVKGLSFADGPGFVVSKVMSTGKRDEAHRFSTMRADEVAAQLPKRFGLFPTIEDADSSV